MPSLPRTDGDDVCLTTRDTPWCPVAYDAAKMLGTRVAETILCRRRQPRDRRYGCKAKVRSKGACKTGGRPDMGTAGRLTFEKRSAHFSDCRLLRGGKK
jgi:hypothetical protein